MTVADPGPNSSFCTVTSDPRATGIALDLVRPLVDETVVAVDARVADRVGELGEVDRLFVIDFEPPLERTLPWLHAQCTGRWVLRLDSDELPSRELLDNLTQLMSARDVTHYWLARRWLHGDDSAYLVSPPWFPDFQARLVRKDAFGAPAQLHEPPHVDGCGRFVEYPIYHLDLLLTSFEARAGKAAAYERERPGIRVEGVALNSGFYLPEVRETRVAPVPDADRAILARARGGRVRTASPRPATTPRLVTRVEIDASRPARDLSPTAYRARIARFGPPPELLAGLEHNVFVRVTNDGTETWPAGVDAFPQIRLGYRFHARDGAVTAEGGRSVFAAPVPPGATAIVPVRVRGPREPGAYTLEIDLVHEHVRCFDTPLRIDLPVSAPRFVLIAAGYSPFRHVGDDAIVRAHLNGIVFGLPDVEAVLLAPSPEPIADRFGFRAERSIHHVLYDGIDVHRELAAVSALVDDRIDELLEEAARARSGVPPADPARRAFFELVSESEMVIFASGGSLTSRYAIAELWPQLVTALIADALGVRVAFSGITVGPLDDAHDRALAGRAFGVAEVIVVRDRDRSARVVRACGATSPPIIEEVDPACSLAPAPIGEVDRVLTDLGLSPGARFVAVSLRANPDAAVDLEALGRLLDHTASRYGLAVLLVPQCTDGSDDDREPLARLSERCSPDTKVCRLDPLPADDVIVGVVGRAALAVGSRYHLAVFAARAGVPALACYEDDYTRQKLLGLRDFAPALVSAVAGDASATTLIASADELLRAAPTPRCTPPIAELGVLARLRP